MKELKYEEAPNFDRAHRPFDHLDLRSGGRRQKPLAMWQCRDFLGVQETYRPVVVSYAEALNNKGKAEEAVVDVEGISTRTPFVVKRCNENPKMMLRDALAGLKN